ncbi:MAG: hypothetical protein HOP28_16515 [Gemmatimonadales bacterium]|nr:hypothetical protein [Gemmatimonadales bacterium]
MRATLGMMVFAAGCAAGTVAPTIPDDSAPGPSLPDPGPAYSYQFGAKFEPPVGRVVHGVGQWQEYNLKYAALLPAERQPASELIFIDIANLERPWNPALIASALTQIGAAGRIPAIDIGLRGNQPGKAALDTMADKLFAIDDEVAHSSTWDGRLLDLVKVLREYRRPALVRIGGEFNGWWNGYHPYDYPKAFRKIVHLFRAGGVENAAFVWCYEPAAPADFDAVDGAGNPKWYPGADVVDWFSIDLFAAGDISGPTGAHGGGLTSYGRTLKFLDMAVASEKPVVIAESSPAFYDLSVPTGAAAAWAEWFSPYFQLIAARPEIKWFHYINYNWLLASYYAVSGWKNNDLSAAPGIISSYLGEVARPKYLHNGEQALLKDFTKYQ